MKALLRGYRDSLKGGLKGDAGHEKKKKKKKTEEKEDSRGGRRVQLPDHLKVLFAGTVPNKSHVTPFNTLPAA